MFGRVEFPRIDDRPLFLTLGPHAFIWFSLEADPTGRGIEVRAAEERAPTITAPADLDALRRRPRPAELTRLLPGYLRARRWFRSKARRIKSVAVRERITVPFEGDDACQARLVLFDVEYTEGEPETYLLPLALARGEEARADRPAALRRRSSRTSSRTGEDGPQWLLYDAALRPDVRGALLDAIGARRRFAGRRGELTASPTTAFRKLRGRRGTRARRSASAAPSRATRRSPSAIG